LGRYAWSSRPTVETSLVLDIFSLKKRGYLIDGWRGTLSWTHGGNELSSIGADVSMMVDTTPKGMIELYYAPTDRPEGCTNTLRYPIGLAITYCNYGRYRWWFRCPLQGCNKRVAKLYLHSLGHIYSILSCQE